MRARMFSTVVTVISVAVGVTLMLILLGMRDSGRKAFERGSGNMHLLVSAEDSPLLSVLNAIFYAGAPSAPLPYTEYLRLAQDPAVEYAIPTLQGDSFRGYPVMASTPEFFTKFSVNAEFDPADPDPAKTWRFARGEGFTSRLEIVLGSEVARAGALGLGAIIHLTHGMAREEGAHVHNEFGYKVVGILAPTGSAHDRALFIHVENSWLMHAHDARVRMAQGEKFEELTLDDLSSADRLITGVYVRARTRAGRQASAVIPALAGELARNPNITVAAPRDQIRKLFEIVSNVDRILLAMAGVVMVSSGIGIMLALYNSMEQRRRQIAVLRILGCSAMGILRLVLMEAALIGLIGAVAGVLLAQVGALIVVQVMERQLGLIVEPQLPFVTVLGVCVVTGVLASLSGLIPALLAYRTSVANNLRPMG